MSTSASSITSIPKFDGSNYTNWSVAVKALFKHHGVNAIVMGTETTPTDSTELAAFTERYDKAYSLIVLSTKQELYHLFAGSEDPAAIWKTLKAAYEKPGALSSFLYFDKLYAAKYTEGASMRSQIENHQRIRQEASAADIKIEDKYFAFAILRALPASYSTLFTSLLSTADVSKLSPIDVTNRIIEEESRRQSDPSVAAFQYKGKKPQKPSVECYYCKKKGHKADVCRKKVADMKGKNVPGPSNSILHTSGSMVDTSSSQSNPASFYASSDSESWMMDTGCTDHMSHHIGDFNTYKTLASPIYITLGDSSTKIPAIGVGSIKGYIMAGGHRQEIDMDSVLHAPSLGCRFLSIRKLDQKGLKVAFYNSKAHILNGQKTLGVGSLIGQHYWLDIHPTPHLNASTTPLSASIWHQRLGHINRNSLSKLKKDNPQMLGIKIDEAKTLPCEGCLKGKQTRRPFPTSTSSRSTGLLDRIHSDLDGPMQTQSISEKAFYILTFIDDFSRHAWVYFLRTKDQQPIIFEEFRAMVENQYNRKIKILRTDRGGEYESKEFKQKLLDLGIIHERTIPDTPQQNGLAERYNRTVVGAAKAMLLTAGLSFGFWVEAVRTAAHVRNRCPSRVIDWKTPHQMVTGRVPDISYLRIFGCKAYIHIPKKKRSNKFESQSSELVFVGYEPYSKGYRLWDKNTRTIKVSTDVRFDESSPFPMNSAPPPPNPPVPTFSDQIQVQLIACPPSSKKQGYVPAPPPSSDTEDDEDKN
jgi:transposase InsO family protein